MGIRQIATDILDYVVGLELHSQQWLSVHFSGAGSCLLINWSRRRPKVVKKRMSTRSISETSYDGRKFRGLTNSETGEVGEETVFHYHQDGDLVWGDYSGGEIRSGSFIAKVLDDRSLDMRYQHLNVRGELMTGVCHSVPELLPDGRLRLYEKWRWTSGDRSEGESVVEEFID
jgi:hypothetical protein